MSITEQISALQAKAAMKQAAVDSCPGHIWRADYVSRIRTGGSCVCVQCGERRAWKDIAAQPVCFACKQPLKDQSYQAETGNWVATGKFPTLDFCSAKCGKDFNRLHPLRA